MLCPVVSDLIRGKIQCDECLHGNVRIDMRRMARALTVIELTGLKNKNGAYKNFLWAIFS